MTALEDDHLDLRLVKIPPEEITAARREAQRLTGHAFPIGAGEIEAYREAGLEPPTE